MMSIAHPQALGAQEHQALRREGTPPSDWRPGFLRPGNRSSIYLHPPQAELKHRDPVYTRKAALAGTRVTCCLSAASAPFRSPSFPPAPLPSHPRQHHLPEELLPLCPCKCMKSQQWLEGIPLAPWEPLTSEWLEGSKHSSCLSPAWSHQPPHVPSGPLWK